MLHFFHIFVVLLFAANEEIDALANMIGKMRASGAYRGGDVPSDFKFEKIFEDLRCNDRAPHPYPPLYSKKVSTYSDCVRLCAGNLHCYYMAYWRQSRLCELTRTCFSKVGDGKSKIGLYRKITACEEKSTEQIAELVREFPSGTLRPMNIPFEWQVLKGESTSSDFSTANMYCRCVSQSWRVCAIFISPGTDEFNILEQKFSRASDAEMEPFYYEDSPMAMIESSQLMLYKRPDITQIGNVFAKQVYQEIKILDFDPTNPAKIPRCLNIHQCNAGTPGGVDPGLHRPFESGDPVWIMQKDIPLLAEKKNVACITMMGLRQLLQPQFEITERTQGLKSFRDPFGRKNPLGDSWLILERDYVLLYVFDEKALSFQICPEGSSVLDLADFDAKAPPAGVNLLEPGAKPPRRRGGKGKKKKRGDSSEEAGSSSADALSPEPNAGSGAASSSGIRSDPTEKHLADFKDLFEIDESNSEEEVLQSIGRWDYSAKLWFLFLIISLLNIYFYLYNPSTSQNKYVELVHPEEI